jgi:hypothetical protein
MWGLYGYIKFSSSRFLNLTLNLIYHFSFKVCHACSTLQMRNEVAFTREEIQQNVMQESARFMAQAMQMYHEKPGDSNMPRIS